MRGSVKFGWCWWWRRSCNIYLNCLLANRVSGSPSQIYFCINASKAFHCIVVAVLQVCICTCLYYELFFLLRWSLQNLFSSHSESHTFFSNLTNTRMEMPHGLIPRVSFTSSHHSYIFDPINTNNLETTRK